MRPFPVHRRSSYADDASLNFACFVYDGVPPDAPTDRTVRTEGLGYVYSSAVLTSLPVYMVIARAADITECIAYDSGAPDPENQYRSARQLQLGRRFCLRWGGL